MTHVRSAALAATAVVALAAGAALALRAGDVDTAFGNGGRVITPVGGGESGLGSAVALADRRIVVAASGSRTRADEDMVVVRYRGDGSLDRTFGAGGYAGADFGHHYDFARSILAQPDGRIVVGGASNAETQDDEFFSRSDFALARFRTDGSLDPAFGTGGKVTTHLDDENVPSVYALLRDGGILLYGYTSGSTHGAALRHVFVKYLPNGHLDPAFGTGGVATIPSGDFGSLVTPSTGKLLLVGAPDNGSGPRVQVTRFNADGSLDTTYGSGGTKDTGVAGQIRSTVLLGGDRVLVLLHVPDRSWHLLRLTAEGSPDATFGSQGLVALPPLGYAKLGVDRTGRIVATSEGGSRFEATRRLPDGSADPSFGNANGTTAATITDPYGTASRVDVPVFQDDRVVVTGTIGMCGCNHASYGGKVAMLAFLGHTPGAAPGPGSAHASASATASASASASRTGSVAPSTSASASPAPTASATINALQAGGGGGIRALVIAIAMAAVAAAGGGAWLLLRSRSARP